MLVRVLQSRSTGRYFASKLRNGDMETASKPEYAMKWEYDSKNRTINFRTFMRQHKKFVEEQKLMERVLEVKE